MFYIEDEGTGTILFAGKVENPLQIEPLPFPSELINDKDSINRFGNVPAGNKNKYQFHTCYGIKCRNN